MAPTLVFLFYELARNPCHADKLYEEIANIDTNEHHKLQGLSHLNGLINETLRLHPPVPSGGYRETPEEGLTVAGRYIPGRTTIVAPRYTISRLSSCFDEPHLFIPERWYDKLELIKNKRAFAPFSQGRYSCVGKALALAELRMVTATLVKNYHVSFAPGEDGSIVEGNMRDQFTAAPGELRLVFRNRD